MHGSTGNTCILYFAIKILILVYYSTGACPPGQFHNDGSCTPCEDSYYQPNPGQDSCIYCGKYYRTYTTGATSKDQCKRELNKNCCLCIKWSLHYWNSLQNIHGIKTARHYACITYPLSDTCIIYALIRWVITLVFATDGPDCDTKCKPPEEGGECAFYKEKYVCVCRSGWVGSHPFCKRKCKSLPNF